MKPDQERVKNLLTDTVTLLCKNGLFFNDELRIEGLLGVTIDSKDAFFVHISEQFGSGAEHNDGNIIANVLSSKDSSKFLSERRKSHRTDDSPQRSRDSARSTPTRPLSQQSSHSPGIREPRSEKRKSLDTPPGVRVKKERYDDDLMLIDSKRRVPLPHGPLSQDDAEAMRQSYGIDANSLGQIQQVQVAHQLGEVKRQSASHLVDAGGGTFVTSMVRQESGATNSPTGNPWPDLAAQVSGGVTQPCDSQMTLDSLPGSSQWSPAQSASQLAATTQPPSASDMALDVSPGPSMLVKVPVSPPLRLPSPASPLGPLQPITLQHQLPTLAKSLGAVVDPRHTTMAKRRFCCSYQGCQETFRSESYVLFHEAVVHKRKQEETTPKQLDLKKETEDGDHPNQLGQVVIMPQTDIGASFQPPDHGITYEPMPETAFPPMQDANFGFRQEMSFQPMQGCEIEETAHKAEKIYKCQVHGCDKQYTLDTNCRRHERQAHKYYRGGSNPK